MNIEKIKQAIELTKLIDDDTCKSNDKISMIGKYVVVRTYSAGCWSGYLDTKDKDEVYLRDARRLWYWKARKSISLSGVSKYGITGESKICPALDMVWLQAIEIIPTTKEAMKSLIEIDDVEAV